MLALKRCIRQYLRHLRTLLQRFEGLCRGLASTSCSLTVTQDLYAVCAFLGLQQAQHLAACMGRSLNAHTDYLRRALVRQAQSTLKL